MTVRHGSPGHHPVVADWDGDGVTDLGTWAPRTAVWTQRHAAKVAGGAETESTSNGEVTASAAPPCAMAMALAIPANACHAPALVNAEL